jgi:hypothetical protein
MRFVFWFSRLSIPFLLTSALLAQKTEGNEPVEVTLCELYQHPEQYQGRIISVRGTILGYKEIWIETPTSQRVPTRPAYMTILLDAPENIRPKPFFKLEKDEAYRQYENAQSKGMRIEATLEGRFDPVFTWKEQKRIRVGEGQGFGKKHRADARIALRRMSDLKTWVLPRR